MDCCHDAPKYDPCLSAQSVEVVVIISKDLSSYLCSGGDITPRTHCPPIASNSLTTFSTSAGLHEAVGGRLHDLGFHILQNRAAGTVTTVYACQKLKYPTHPLFAESSAVADVVRWIVLWTAL
jgi:hypothetical protein